MGLEQFLRFLFLCGPSKILISVTPVICIVIIAMFYDTVLAAAGIVCIRRRHSARTVDVVNVKKFTWASRVVFTATILRRLARFPEGCIPTRT